MAVHKGSEAERVGMALKEKGFYLRMNSRCRGENLLVIHLSGVS